MTKAQILDEIRRTTAANSGTPLGKRRFEVETGIKASDWFGIHWARWGDAVREAGFSANKLNEAHDTDFMLQRFAELAVELGRLPVSGDLRLKKREDQTFPNSKTFDRLGNKSDLVRLLAEYCRPREAFASVLAQCTEYLRESTNGNDEGTTSAVAVGYVYLIKHGSRREYKIGRTNNKLRREGEIAVELPERIEPIHVIETDDPSGIEAYWHRRFADKRLNNEWFALSADDVRAFKRWRRIV